MNIILTSALSLMSLLCFASFSYAEDITFDDMTVTATRSERSSLELPASIDIKSANEVEVDKASTQRELLNSIAGVRLTQTGSTIGHTTSIRLPQSTNPYYLFLQDSIPIQSSGFLIIMAWLIRILVRRVQWKYLRVLVQPCMVLMPWVES